MGKAHDMLYHQTLEADLKAYLDGTGIGTDTKGPLFRTIAHGTERLSTTPLPKVERVRDGAGGRWPLALAR